MKGCILLQRNFAYIGQAIAVQLKKKYGVNDFCGYVYGRHGFAYLKKQTEIDYSELLLDDDIRRQFKNEKVDYAYLKKLEKEIGLPNLWPYLAVDRGIMHNQQIREYPYDTPPYTHEEMLLLLQVYAKTIFKFLEKEKPDFVLFSVAGALGSLLMFHLAKKLGIKTYFIMPTTTEKNYTISENYNHFTGVDEKMKTNLSAESLNQAAVFINQFRNRPASYNEKINLMLKQTSRTHYFKFIKSDNIVSTIKSFIEQIKYSIKNSQYNDYSTKHAFKYHLIDKIKRKVRNMIGLSDLYDTYQPDKKFSFFPLHYEPEIALMLQAPFFINQLSLIRLIAKSLPVAFTLYVKEHPAMIQYRPRRFYRELKKIPNVKIINPAISSFEIIPRAEIIFSITGTAGWESIILKKPVIVFGNYFYDSLSTVKKCLEIEKLPYLIEEQLTNFKYNEEEITKFIAAIFEESADINLEKLWYDEDDIAIKIKGVEPLADLIAKKLLIGS